ncbi:MAG: hypothetical protein F8N36_09125 [Desulfovibrio sp.]|nr:hypothetical protein [Desulfovibrio sp.]
MNASVPPGWRPSFAAKQRRPIGSGASAQSRKRRGSFHFSSLISIRSFLAVLVFTGRLACPLWQSRGTVSPDFIFTSFVNLAAQRAKRDYLLAYSPSCSLALHGGFLFCGFYQAGSRRSS